MPGTKPDAEALSIPPRRLHAPRRPGHLGALLALWYRRRRQRRHLAELGDHLLRDIGKTRRQALAEAEKPFWRP